MSSPFNAMMEGERQLINDAEDIFSRWKKKEFTLDPRATKEPIVLTSNKPVTNWLGHEKIKEVKRNVTVADMFANAISHYEKDRGSPYYWRSVAGDLVYAYHTAESYGLVVTSKDEQIRRLEAEVEDLKTNFEDVKKRATDFEDKFRTTNDKLLETDNDLAKCRKELADIRGQDISKSLKHGVGTLHSGIGEEDKEDEG